MEFKIPVTTICLINFVQSLQAVEITTIILNLSAFQARAFHQNSISSPQAILTKVNAEVSSVTVNANSLGKSAKVSGKGKVKP